MTKTNSYKNFVINSIAKIYAFLININLYIISKDKNKYFYNHSLGFGDSFIFYLKNYNKINKYNSFALSFGTPTMNSIKFFFSSNRVKKILFQIPNRIYYRVVVKLVKHKYFKPKIYGSFSSQYQYNNSIYYRKLILKLLKRFKINKEIKKFRNEKYICIFIKHNNDDINNLNSSNSRQTANLQPIKKIILFLNKKKISTLVLGLNSDKSVGNLEKFVKKNKLEKSVYFLKNLSKKYSLQDQVFVAENSIGYIGSTSGPVSLFYFLRKKIIIINCPKGEDIPLCKNKKNEKKFIRYLYKYTNKKKKIPIDDKVNSYKEKVYEVSFGEIKSKFVNFIN